MKQAAENEAGEANAAVNGITITVNGSSREVEGGRSVEDLLASLGLHPRMVVVEHNREILDRERFGEVEVRDGDTLEVVHFVGGG